jgi:5'-nucleotidase
MNLLISNDDGYQAQGINFLFEELSKYNTKMVAPHDERSSCGHAITLGAPVRVKQIKENIYSCTGKPADCVLIGMSHVCDEKPDLVVSGINHGANLGQDRFYSGTIAAAREAVFRDVPAIAISLVTKGIKDMEHFEVGAKIVDKLIQQEIHKYIPPMHLLNINVPNIPWEKIAGHQLTTLGFQIYTEEVIERKDARGLEYYWVGGIHAGHKDIAGSDCVTVEQGLVSYQLQNLDGSDPDPKDLTKLQEIISSL